MNIRNGISASKLSSTQIFMNYDQVQLYLTLVIFKGLWWREMKTHFYDAKSQEIRISDLRQEVSGSFTAQELVTTQSEALGSANPFNRRGNLRANQRAGSDSR